MEPERLRFWRSSEMMDGGEEVEQEMPEKLHVGVVGDQLESDCREPLMEVLKVRRRSWSEDGEEVEMEMEMKMKRRRRA